MVARNSSALPVTCLYACYSFLVSLGNVCAINILGTWLQKVLNVILRIIREADQIILRKSLSLMLCKPIFHEKIQKTNCEYRNVGVNYIERTIISRRFGYFEEKKNKNTSSLTYKSSAYARKSINGHPYSNIKSIIFFSQKAFILTMPLTVLQSFITIQT